VVILDALRVKIRNEGVVRNKAGYLAIGIARDGTRDVLGLWLEQTEGAAFWLRIMTELKSRGVEDILIALIDGLAGFPEAITTVFPQTQIHHCMVTQKNGQVPRMDPIAALRRLIQPVKCLIRCLLDLIGTWTDPTRGAKALIRPLRAPNSPRMLPIQTLKHPIRVLVERRERLSYR
jgi:hypothetical protein